MSENNQDDLLARILDDPEVQAAGQDPPAEAVSVPGMQGNADGLLSALPPDLLGKLPAMLGMLSPALGGKADGKKDEKTALLMALKPYMSPRRCDAIDKLIMFGRISELLGHFR